MQIASSVYDGPTPLQRLTFNTYDSYLNIIEKQESGWFPCTPSSSGLCPIPSTGPWLRQTYTIFSGDSNASTACNATILASKYIVNKPCQIVGTDGSNKAYSLVSYSYDNNGNLLNESKCVSVSGNGSSASCSSSWQTQYSYDGTGQLLQKIEGYGTSAAATTAYTWTGPTGQTDSYNGYLTKITHPDGTTDQYSYYYNSGQLATHSDANSQTTQYLYNDPGNLSRLTETKYPDRGDVQISYNDATPPSVTVTTATGEVSGPIVRTTQYDGLGRTVQTQLNSDPYGTDYVDTTYDANGRVYTVSNPHRTTSSTTDGTTYYLYDALNRPLTVTNPDNTKKRSGMLEIQ